MENWTLKDPLWLLALLALPIIAWLRDRRGAPALIVPYSTLWYKPGLTSISKLPEIFAYLGIGLLIIALARPQIIQDKREVHKEGYDLMLAIDLSGSMLAEDYEQGGNRINRLQAIKPVIEAFIKQRTSDRIGIVVFAGRAYTLSPLTFDHEWLERQIARLKIGLLEDGTAIGDGLGVALSRLEQAKKEKGNKRKGAFVILLTDGANNKGALTPIQVAQLAKEKQIPIYTIGAGKDGIVPMPAFDKEGNKVGYYRVRSDLDEPTLRNIAELTKGHYFRAADSDTIKSAFESIDEVQKIEFQAKSYLLTKECFHWFAIPGLFSILAGALAARKPWTKEATL